MAFYEGSRFAKPMSTLTVSFAKSPVAKSKKNRPTTAKHRHPLASEIWSKRGWFSPRLFHQGPLSKILGGTPLGLVLGIGGACISAVQGQRPRHRKRLSRYSLRMYSSRRLGLLGSSHKVEPSDNCGIFGEMMSRKAHHHKHKTLAIKSSIE